MDVEGLPPVKVQLQEVGELVEASVNVMLWLEHLVEGTEKVALGAAPAPEPAMFMLSR